MGSWGSFAAGWRAFWTCRGVVAVAAINFGINFVVSLIIGLLMVVAFISAYISLPKPGFSPHYRTISQTFPSIPGFGPFHHPAGPFGPLSGWPSSLASGLILTGVLVFLVFMAMSAFIAAATPGTLLAAVKKEFSVPGYFMQARSFFWRAFAFMWFDLAVLLMIFSLFGIIGIAAYKTAGLPGILAAALVIICGSVFAGGVLLITRMKYLISKDQGLFAYVGQAAAMVYKRYWPWLALLLIMTIFSLLVTALSFILLLIPFIGAFLVPFITFSLLNIIYVSVMSFAGLTCGQT